MGAKLKLATDTSSEAKPSRKLGQHGADLWARVTSEYAITDAGGVELLPAGINIPDKSARICRRQPRTAYL